MNSILKSTTLALLMLSTAAVIGCGRNSEPNRYPDNRYGRNGSPFPPNASGPVGGEVAGGPVGPGGVPGGPAGGPGLPGGGPVGPGGGIGPGNPGGAPGQGQGGNQNQNGEDDWHDWNCSTQNLNVQAQVCVSNDKDSEHSDNVISLLEQKSDQNTNFPVYMLWSKSLARQLQLTSKEKVCLKNKLCSADIEELNYSTEQGQTQKPKYDPTSDFNPQAQNGQQGQNGRQGQGQQAQQGQDRDQQRQGNRLPQRDPNQNTDQDDNSDQ